MGNGDVSLHIWQQRAFKGYTSFGLHNSQVGQWYNTQIIITCQKGSSLFPWPQKAHLSLAPCHVKCMNTTGVGSMVERVV